jgi:Ca2+-binding EF-hand superfamily protein
MGARLGQGMKKSLVMLLVASLLLAGCTELLDSGDGETLKIEVDEEIAIEKLNDFLTVDQDESFGISMMYEMDPAMMDGMIEADENSTTTIVIEETQAWSPDGYHKSTVMGLNNGDSSIRMIDSLTHIGTTIYVEIGYETQGDLCFDEDTPEEVAVCESQMAMLPEVEAYSMTTTTTHTEIIAAMAEETNMDDEMDPMAMLEIFSYAECMGTFTPAGSIDDLQLFNVSMGEFNDDSLTPETVLCMFDTDNSNTISFEEFLNSEGGDEEDIEEMELAFNESDLDVDGELTSDELLTFIEAVNSNNEQDDDEMGDDEMGDDEMMPDMSIAFNDAGEIEYFSMFMEGTEMKINVLSENKVESLFANVDVGEIVALPFQISSDMVFDDGDDDEMGDGDGDGDDDDGSADYIDAYLTDNWDGYENQYVDPELSVYTGFDDISDVQITLYEFDGESQLTSWNVETSEFVDMGGMGMTYYVSLDDNNLGDDCYVLVATITDIDGDIWQWGNSLCYDHNNGDDGDDSSPEEVMQMFDTNEDGSLSWSEFWDSWMADGGAAEDEESLSAIFNDSDSDMDGLLSIEELEYFIAEVSTFDNENMEDEFICDDGSTIPMSYVNDGSEDCDGGEDESDMSGNEDYEMWTFLREMSECDSDTDEMVNFEELDACVSMDLTNDGYDSDSFEGLQEMFDMVDANEDGMLDSDEFATFATMTNGEPMMVCYNMDTHEIDMSINSEADCEAAGLMWTEEDSGQDDSDNNGEDEFVCDDGSTIPMSYVNDGEEDCDGGEDEYATDDSDDGNNGHGNDDDGHDESNPGNSHDEIVMYITTGEDFYFEGDMSDYKIELASCEEDYSDTGELTRTCETVMSIAINDAGMDSNIMFHDADSSGTISVGDMVHIGETSEEWDTVRLYSVSADAYSDEYPVHNAPGFTGLVGMLALLGAAFIRRSE